VSDVAVRVDDLGKRYKIGGLQSSYGSLRESVTSAVAAPVRRLLHPGSSTGVVEEFWALRHVSFEVIEGQAVGIIGRNGAGKSTLLKILSRITEPTEGHIHIRGRVRSLLEVGTGFHAELTGRENIYMNGAILGMRRAEIRKKFDEIVAFSEIGQFLDTPVKRYSSGMYVRLAFAVAAHLEPEILVVDEVLSVGDLGFQRKCLGKMQDVAGEGRTVLFVSHNLGAVVELCDRGILLEDGCVVEDASSAAAVNRYMAKLQVSNGVFDLTDQALRQTFLHENAFRWTRLTVIDSRGSATEEVGLRDPFQLVIEAVALRRLADLVLNLSVYSGSGVCMFNSYQTASGLPSAYEAGPVAFRVTFDPNLFAPGHYTIGLWATGPTTADHIRVAAQFSVSHVDPNGGSLPANYVGIILYPCVWTLDGEHQDPAPSRRDAHAGDDDSARRGGR
jgi:lipopolysaccharide transport system ATP-binding protein